MDKALVRDQPAVAGGLLSRSALARLLAAGAVTPDGSSAAVTDGSARAVAGSRFRIALPTSQPPSPCEKTRDLL